VTVRVTLLAASAGCYGLKLAGVSLPQSVLNHPRVKRIAALSPIALLSALVVSNLFYSDRHYTADWHTLAGVGAVPAPCGEAGHWWSCSWSQ
jgi:branched-subunit amino acid transport protein